MRQLFLGYLSLLLGARCIQRMIQPKLLLLLLSQFSFVRLFGHHLPLASTITAVQGHDTTIAGHKQENAWPVRTHGNDCCC
jgi:hypothetical protein